MKLVTLDELEQILPQTEELQRCRSYFQLMQQGSSEKMISNVHSEVLFLLSPQVVMPVTYTDSEEENCYVCSPHAHYVRYAALEAKLLKNPLLRVTAYAIIHLLDRYLQKRQFNRVVYLNNWFLSTNLYPDFSAEQLQKALELLKRKFPRRTIVLRSLNGYTNRSWMDNAEAIGFKPIAARQIYITDPRFPQYRSKRDFKRDWKILQKSTCEIMEHQDFSMDHVPRIVELYNDLYLNKYTTMNPRFTGEFIAAALKDRFLTFRGIREEGRLLAVLGYFHRKGVMTAPVFGYDRSFPQEKGLYRMLSQLNVQESETRGWVLNQSSGAGVFKRNRGCRKYIEYNYYYNGHLSAKQRRAWDFLAALVNRLFKPQLERKDF